jgi:hypothetical protein
MRALSGSVFAALRREAEHLVDEGDLALDARFHVIDVVVFDCSDGVTVP